MSDGLVSVAFAGILDQIVRAMIAAAKIRTAARFIFYTPR